MMTVQIRRASAQDADQLRDCIIAAYAPFQKYGLPPVAEGIADDVRDHNVWVAERDGVVCGGIVLVLGPHAHVANLAVHPDGAGRGVGQALLEVAVQAATAAGHPQIQLATHALMAGTQAFYRKMGWEETGRDGNKVYLALKLK